MNRARLWLAGLRKSLTYPNVVSTLALFIALGGTSYAVVTIDGNDLKNRSVRGVKVTRNTLGAAEIRESRLGKVPRATNADRVGGLTARAFRVRCPAGTVPAVGVCVESAARAPASYGTALQTCLGVGFPPGRRLPTPGELTAALAGVPLAPGGELTSEITKADSDPSGGAVLYVTDRTGSTSETPRTVQGAKAYRCVAAPTN
jgi:hypothetical protein